MDRAAARLRVDDSPLKEIAAELGFCDEFHFSKLFKRRTGLSPSAYRTQLGSRKNKSPAPVKARGWMREPEQKGG
jgi:AraC-like DNA-binding protein